MSGYNMYISRKGTGSVRWDFAVKRAGEPDLIPLTTADMDFRTAEPIREVLRQITDFGIYGYTGHKDSYYDAIIRRFREKWNWEIRREWIVCSPTIIAAAAYCIQGMTEPGDTVILPTPMYHPFQHIIRENGRTLAESPMLFDRGRYGLDFRDLEEKMRAGARMLIFCNPHNPAGIAWTEDELVRVCALCRQYDVILLSDEIHCDFVFSGHSFVSMSRAAALVGDAAEDKLIVCSSGSKSFNLAGLQVSNIIIPGSALRQKYEHVMRCQGFDELNMMGTAALETAYTDPACQVWLEETVRYLENNRNFAFNWFCQRIPEIVPVLPEATYMMWLDCRGLGLSEEALEQLFLHKAKVGVNPGSTFGTGGAGFVRLNFATPRSILEQALRRIEEALHG